MAVIAVGRNYRVVLANRRLHPDHDRFLTDIEVTEAADQPHAVELARALLKAPDQQHVAIILLQGIGVVDTLRCAVRLLCGRLLCSACLGGFPFRRHLRGSCFRVADTMDCPLR